VKIERKEPIMYAVFGATGHTGGVVARALLQHGKEVRAFVRDAGKGESLRAAGAQLSVVDLLDRTKVSELLRGVAGAYVMLPPRVDSEDLLASARALCDALAGALAEAGVPHVVFLSSVGAHLPDKTGPILSNRYGEQVLRQATPALSALRPPYFMENWAEALAGLSEGRLASLLALDHVIPMIATEDIGRAAAALLLEGPRGHQVIELSGPRDYSPRDVARVLSTLLGREIVPEGLTNAAIPGLLASFGMSPINAELFREMHAGIDSGRISPEGNGARQLKGQIPIEQVLRALLPA
jgi:uncharacterized protein YbjT (DUF2867 family)